MILMYSWHSISSPISHVNLQVVHLELLPWTSLPYLLLYPALDEHESLAAHDMDDDWQHTKVRCWSHMSCTWGHTVSGFRSWSLCQIQCSHSNETVWQIWECTWQQQWLPMTGLLERGDSRRLSTYPRTKSQWKQAAILDPRTVSLPHHCRRPSCLCRKGCKMVPPNAFQVNLEIASSQSRTACVWWAIHLWCMDHSTRWTTEATTGWWMQPGEGNCWVDVLVGCRSPCTVR